MSEVKSSMHEGCGLDCRERQLLLNDPQALEVLAVHYDIALDMDEVLHCPGMNGHRGKSQLCYQTCYGTSGATTARSLTLPCAHFMTEAEVNEILNGIKLSSNACSTSSVPFGDKNMIGTAQMSS